MPSGDLFQDITHALVGRYFDAAVKATKQTDPQDQRARKAALSGLNDGQEILAGWIRSYSINRLAWDLDRAGSTFADMAAVAALSTFSTMPASCGPTVPEAFLTLRRAMDGVYEKGKPQDKRQNKRQRSFISLTAKLLWCRYPEEAPIYDAYASAGVIFLIKLAKCSILKEAYGQDSTRPYDNHDGYVNWKEESQITRDAWTYKDFYRSHLFLFRNFGPLISGRLTQSDNASLSPFRVFDKLLLILGNRGEDYSLLGGPLDQPPLTPFLPRP